MATAVADSYSCASGRAIVGGAYLHLPATGQRNNVNLNTAYSVDPDGGVAYPGEWYNGYSGANSLSSMFSAWNAAIWCPEYSRHGAMVWYGGGHGANTGCFATIFDLTTRLWSVVGTQNLTGDGSWMSGSRDSSWFDYTLAGSTVYVLTHQYSTISYIKPGYSGVGSKGALYMPFVNDPVVFSAVRYAPHLLDLNTGVVSRAVVSPSTDGAQMGSSSSISVLDTGNEKIWLFNGDAVRYLDLTEAHPRTLQTHEITYESGNPWGTMCWIYDSEWTYCPDAEMILAVDGAGTTNGALTVVLIDVASGWPVVTNVAVPNGTALHGGDAISCCWVPDLKKFYLYEGCGDTFCITLTPSILNFRTCTWTWGKESFSGVAPANANGTQSGAINSVLSAWRRMRYSESLKCLTWCDGANVSGTCVDSQTRTGIFQLWKPPGTPV
jgi:hypothetical protein